MQSNRFKIVIVVADGLGDRAVPELNGKTPLEVASKDDIDWLASKGINGLWDPIAPGIRPGSDTAHLALFGIDPTNNYPGRGPFEAIGTGAELEPGDVALRGNFATVDEELKVIDRRAGRYLPENKELVKYLNENVNEIDGVKVRFYAATEHRVAVVLKGDSLSPKVSDTDPHMTGVKVLTSRPLDNSYEARRTAKVINKLTKIVHELLKKHELNEKRIMRGLPPANIILLRGAGQMIKYPTFKERESVIIDKALAISATAMIKGVCKLLGMEVVTPKGATGGVDTDVMAKAKTLIDYCKKGYDLIYMHVKGTDSASHDGRADLKIKLIERINSAVRYILDHVDLGNTVIVFTGDHTTPIVVRDHTGDPVPVAIYAPNILPDDVKIFSERSARKGGLGRIRREDLFNTLLDLANRREKFGA